MWVSFFIQWAATQRNTHAKKGQFRTLHQQSFMCFYYQFSLTLHPQNWRAASIVLLPSSPSSDRGAAREKKPWSDRELLNTPSFYCPISKRQIDFLDERCAPRPQTPESLTWTLCGLSGKTSPRIQSIFIINQLYLFFSALPVFAFKFCISPSFARSCWCLHLLVDEWMKVCCKLLIHDVHVKRC